MSQLQQNKNDVPDYEYRAQMCESRSPYAEQFAKQILQTCSPYLTKPKSELSVLDIGCGYGGTALALSHECKSVTGIDPVASMIQNAIEIRDEIGSKNTEFARGELPDWKSNQTFDLIVLDNVFEHMQYQQESLERIAELLNPGGACFLLTPNRLWPIEVHYRLPFLSYLPLRLANTYLRATGRGRDYTDCSYSLTYGRLASFCKNIPDLKFKFVLPADIRLATRGNAWTYRWGVYALRNFPVLWWISKALLVVLWKEKAK